MGRTCEYVNDRNGGAKRSFDKRGFYVGFQPNLRLLETLITGPY